MRCAALGNDVSGATFATSALGGNTQLELHFVEGHSGTRVAGNVAV